MSKLVRFDWAIKYLLKNKANFDILEGFLSELLKMQIKIVNILESESNKTHAKDKFNRVDLFAKTAQNQYIIIEVQCSSEWDYLSRILYGASKMVCEYLRSGDPYRHISKIISVSIVFFNLGEGKDYLYKGSTQFKGLHYNDTLSLNAEEQKMYGQTQLPLGSTPDSIFPEYFIIKVPAFNERVQDKFDEWIYFLKHEKIEKNFHAQGIQSAAKKLDLLYLSEEERRAYDYYEEGLHDEGSLVAQYNIVRAEGHAEGCKEMQLKIAIALKNAGAPDTEIVSYTGLPLSEIKKLEMPATATTSEP